MNYDILIDLHKFGNRQGPGDDRYTKLALELSGKPNSNEKLKVVDIGCGTGASSLILAEHLNAEITCVDLFPEFLNILEQEAEKNNLSDKISTLQCSMDSLPFEENSLDVIWGEGSIYNIGFENGVKYLSKFLKVGGVLAVSEITWF